MKSLVVFYSLEGNTKLMADTIAKIVDADILELKTKKDISSKGFMKFVWGGRSVMKNEEPDLMPFDIDLDKYETLFIGTPVWAWTYAPALNSFFSNYLVSKKKIALFCCHGGGKGKTLNKMKQALGDNEFLGQIDFKEPLKCHTERNLSRVVKWAQEMVNLA